jgi:hypothetical protein
VSENKERVVAAMTASVLLLSAVLSLLFINIVHSAEALSIADFESSGFYKK